MEDYLAHQVYLVKGSQVKMVCQDSQACQVLKVTQDHQVCLESQDCQDSVNQDFQDQRVIKAWVGHLDLLDQKEKKAMEDYQVCLDPLDQMVLQAPLAQWDPQEV